MMGGGEGKNRAQSAKYSYERESYPTTSGYYDSFMKHHLQYYGYYANGNEAVIEQEAISNNNKQHRENYDFRLSGQHQINTVEDDIGDFLNRTTQIVFHYQQGRKVPKLREPRNLYALTREAGPQQATRWPSHVQCVLPPPTFVDAVPDQAEPLLKPTGTEATPSIRGGQVVYLNEVGPNPFFVRSKVIGHDNEGDEDSSLASEDSPRIDDEQQGKKRRNPDDLTLEFESRFESGNLYKAEKITDLEYELTLRPDLYTAKHTQWFFFRVRNMRKGRTYRFTITNLMKPSSLYNSGMQPVFYSQKDAELHQIGWRRRGEEVRYYKNNLFAGGGRSLYSLTWTCSFEHDDDTCYLAHCYPYTYTDLQRYLLRLANDPLRSQFCKQRVLCRTLAGNLVYVLTITTPSVVDPQASPPPKKRAIVITARVHPGETNSSYMMKGFLDYLTGTTPDAALLRDTFIFKIVPMLNPDGVVVGNYRCSLTGRDLNRNYKSSLKDSFPSIWNTKAMIKRLHEEREVVLYCDLHGHSRKHNVFIYGCENKKNPDKKLKEKVFPLMLSKNSRSLFSFKSCKYKVQRSKEGTGRIVMWCMGVTNSYTMEATFGGSTLEGKHKDMHLRTSDLEAIGQHFCDTILDYCDPDHSKHAACMRELNDRMRRRQEMKSRGDASLSSVSSSDTSGSDSSCDNELPVSYAGVLLRHQSRGGGKKKLRTRGERSKLHHHHHHHQDHRNKMVPSTPEPTKVVLPRTVESKPRIREKKEPPPPPPQEEKARKCKIIEARNNTKKVLDVKKTPVFLSRLPRNSPDPRLIAATESAAAILKNARPARRLVVGRISMPAGPQKLMRGARAMRVMRKGFGGVMTLDDVDDIDLIPEIHRAPRECFV